MKLSAFVAVLGWLLVLGGVSLAGQSRATRPKVQRPDGPVWDVIRKNCTACHGIDDYAFFSLDRDGWRKLLADKHKPDGDGLSDADRSVLLDWMVSKFGPDTKPFPRTYIPPEITTFFSDPEAKRLMNRACTKCHGVDRVENERNSADGLAGTWWICGSGELSSRTRSWSNWWNGSRGYGERIRTNETRSVFRIDTHGRHRRSRGGGV